MEQLACRPALTGIDVLGLRLDVTGDPGPFSCALAVNPIIDGVVLVELTVTSQNAHSPPALTLRLAGQAAGIAHTWRPDRSGSIGILPDWSNDRLASRASCQAPVLCLHGIDGGNRLTIASADALHGGLIGAGVREEDGRLIGHIEPFLPGRAPGRTFSLRLRLDVRAIPWHQAIQDVSRWWEAMPGHTPLAVPAAGREPMYSTWYSFHQACDPKPVLAECRRARALGCTAVIVDDGWQTLDTSRGYHLAGDWQPERMGDMRAFVDGVHALGMGVLLWYAVPLIGFQTAAYRRFERCLLRRDERLGCAIADPRYPEVRAFLADLYTRQLAAWGHDGVKLDFVDCMQPVDGMPLGAGDGRDIGDLDEAVDALMKDIAARMIALRPDLLIEFRQGYIGPLMRTYGNLFRAGDCPYDAAANRARTIAIRMLAGSTATHADMLMWSPLDPPAVAARQFLAILFAVPQVSVMIERLTAAQRAMLAFWLGWWREHRDTLLDGTLVAEEPEAGCPQVTACAGDERITAIYAERVVRLGNVPPRQVWLVNATARNELVIALTQSMHVRLVVRDCSGTIIQDEAMEFAAGVHLLRIPASGLALVSRAG